MPRDGKIRGAILGMILAYAVAVLSFTDRARLIGSRARILPGVSIPTASAPQGYAEALDRYGVHLPKRADSSMATSRRADAAPLAPPERLHFGYSIVETAVLGAPYWYSTDDGHVIYYETLREFVYAPVSEAYMRKVHLPGPMPLSGQAFAWWRQLWGWVFPLALAGWGWFESGAARRKRAAEGVI